MQKSSVFQLSPCKVPSVQLGLCCKVHCLRQGQQLPCATSNCLHFLRKTPVLFSKSGKQEPAWQDWIQHAPSHAFKSPQAVQVPFLPRLQPLQGARPENPLGPTTRTMTSVSFNRVTGTQHNLGKTYRLECKALCCTFASQRA